MEHRMNRCVSWVVVIAVAAFGLFACSDYRSAPIEVAEGVSVVVEPGDEFTIGLLAHPGFPDAAWVITEIDEAVVEIRESVHTPRAGAAPPPELLPGYAVEIYSTMPEPDRPPDADGGPEGPLWYVPDSHFLFAGKDYGDTELRFELRIGDELSATFAFDVSVVEDACDFFEGQDAATQVPHRCG